MKRIAINYIGSLFIVVLLWQPLTAVADPGEGALTGQFSVSPYNKVYFSQGNLEFLTDNTVTHACADGTTKPGKWRFHDHQYNRVPPGTSNTQSTMFGGWMDLFQWASSGYGSRNPWARFSSGFPTTDLTGDNAFYDPGVYNAIENGGNEPGLWRMLSKDEMDYLLYTRPNARQKWGKARVHDVNGMVLLPDEWETPEGTFFIPSYTSSPYPSYSNAQWELMEAAGAVFLPICGCVPVGNSSYSDYNNWGEYHLSTTANTRDSAQYREGGGEFTTRNYSLDFNSGAPTRVTCKGDMKHSRRHSLRLVQDVSFGATPTISVVSEGIEPEYPDTAVDLGLSVRWSSINIGATQPTDLGNLYAWGETTTKDTYTQANYQFYQQSGSYFFYTKYWYSQYTNYLGRDGRDVLEPEDDAATVNWGPNWRMPTKEELEELYSHCTRTRSTEDGHSVLRFQGVGEASGNSIVVPSSTLSGNNYFWTSTIYIESPDANGASTKANMLKYNMIGPNNRQVGCPVRPVCTIGKSHIVVQAGTTKAEGDYFPGAVLSIEATEPNSCTHFVRWSDGDTNRTRTITVAGDATYYAIYEYSPSHTVTVVPDDPSHGSTAVVIVP